MRKNQNFFDRLPDGSTFEFWDCTTDFKKTYYVSKVANACDANPGTEAEPLATISKAAEVLRPGEKVIIGGGVYDEFVRPARGGEGPDKMISYEAAPGEKVVLTGAREYKNGWQKPYGWRTHGLSVYYNPRDTFDSEAAIYEGNFEQSDFSKGNPFSMVNCASQAFGGCEFWFHYLPKESDWRPFLKRRGLLFCDGEALTQVNYLCHLSQVPGSYWVEDSGFKIFIRLKDDSDPSQHTITYTARDQLFMPAVPYTGYIRVKGLAFEYVGNGVPGSQKGALSTFCGNHWIIEDNKVRWANGVGIDFGHITTERYSNEISGGSIVRRNHVSNCGVCGIAALPGSPDRNKSILMEYNVLDDNAWHDIEFNYENGGIKVHGIVDSLIRFNIVRRTGYGSAIWADFGNINSRICGNVVLGGECSIMGGIFIEASDVLNVIDHNLVFDYNRNPLGTIPQRTSGGGHGIYQHDCDYVQITRNILLGMEGTGVFLNWGDPIRICNGHGPMGVGFEVNENIIADCDRAYVMPTEKNSADSNIIGIDYRAKAPIMIERNHEIHEMLDMRAARMYHDWEQNGKMCDIDYEIDVDKLTLRLIFKVEEETFTQDYDLTKPFDLQPVFDYLSKKDTSRYEQATFGTVKPKVAKYKR